MANINGVNPPVLNDQDYVEKIINSFTAVDEHDHSPGKGVALTTGSLADGAVTNAKVATAAAIARTKLADGDVHRLLLNDASGVMGQLAALTDGQLAIGSTGAAPVPAALTGTANQVAVANGAGSITLSLPQNVHTEAAVRFLTAVLGSDGLDASAIFQMNSTEKGLLPPRMTTAQRDAIASPANGLIVYNSDTNQLNIYNAGSAAWGAVGGATHVESFTGTSFTATNDPTQVWRYTGASAQILAVIDPGNLSDGELIEITGTSDTNTIELNHNDVTGGWLLNGSWVGYRGSKLQLRYDEDLIRFLEVSRQ